MTFYLIDKKILSVIIIKNFNKKPIYLYIGKGVGELWLDIRYLY